MTAAAQPRQAASGSGGDVDPSRAQLAQLHALQAMRADARAWLGEIERRIAALDGALPRDAIE